MSGFSARLQPIGWAAYLAVSWTWCIGMFLPVLLLRDSGAWGFVLFGVPNVLGAAAMGFVLSRRASEEIERTHGTALTLFSVVTLAYHFFFCAWVLRSGGGVAYAALGAVIGGWALGMMLRRGWTVIGTLGLAVSLVLFQRLIAGGLAPTLRLGEARDGSALSLTALAGPVVMGFVLCPYLDRTFHHALRSSACRRTSFGVGFGLFFLLMIVMTTAYAPLLVNGSHGELAGLVLAHMGIQAGLTIAMHGERLRSAGVSSRHGVLVGVVLLVAFVVGRIVEGRDLAHLWELLGAPEMATGEVVYRAFLGFYGLVAPAYVWLCMIPGRGGGIWDSPEGRRRARLVWLGVCSAAAPMFWLGFIEGRELFLVPGIAIVLLARLLVYRGGSAEGAAPSAARA